MHQVKLASILFGQVRLASILFLLVTVGACERPRSFSPTPIDLSEVVEAAKSCAVVVYFYSRTCSICTELQDEVRALERSVDVMLISMDEDRGKDLQLDLEDALGVTVAQEAPAFFCCGAAYTDLASVYDRLEEG